VGRIQVINLEAGLPTVEEARARLRAALDECRRAGTSAVKVIHGYGSSGKGGALRSGVRASLHRRRKEGLVKHVVHGERWSAFEEEARRALEACPALRKDRDLERGNEGITIVVLA
jgi:hypothetical protein